VDEEVVDLSDIINDVEPEQQESIPQIEGLELLPTGKYHLSYSEVAEWSGCSWRHKLKHILKVDLDEPGWGSTFGKAIHSSCEDFLKTRVMKPEIAIETIKNGWKEHQFFERGKAGSVEEFVQFANDILEDIPSFMDETFPNWLYIDAEHFLYQKLDRPHAFKGYIDGIIECDGKRGRVKWLIDFKTCGWGWSMQKKQDFMVKAQLILYKNFWLQETNTPPKDVRCGFVLLKRSAKKGKHCELVAVSVGNVTTGRALQVVNDMVYHVKRGTAIKNKSSCKFCPYKGTEHCTGTELA